MSYTTKNIIEIVDGVHGMEKIQKKRKMLRKFFNGLGPPDMCYMLKTFKRSFFGKGKQAQGYYFYPYGVNTSTPIAITIFLKNVVEG